jgi:hypothetical protein
MSWTIAIVALASFLAGVFFCLGLLEYVNYLRSRELHWRVAKIRYRFWDYVRGIEPCQ